MRIGYAILLAALVGCTREAPVTVYVAEHGICRYAATGGEAPSELCGSIPQTEERHEAEP